MESSNKTGVYEARFINPDSLIAELGIAKGMKVAHFGCSTGHFTFAAARAVGENGEVEAFDVLEQKIDLVRGQARIFGLNNVIARLANLEERDGSKLAAESMDWVLMINILYQNDKKSRIIGEAKRILKPDGHILLVEWGAGDLLLGPEKNSRASREELIKIIRKHGLGIAKEIEAGQLHWGMILVKS
ncbi:MAG: methyltransferase domain-containing protein [Candidatus Pacebacteria bacterium]|nr:methyltransferase domain-containing protein [Candidatus Paceibacterota bacterium]MDR3583691.1 methyltransferase domain-containing protein [Candidatus Paceibacterota bacterium]